MARGEIPDLLHRMADTLAQLAWNPRSPNEPAMKRSPCRMRAIVRYARLLVKAYDEWLAKEAAQ